MKSNRNPLLYTHCGTSTWELSKEGIPSRYPIPAPGKTGAAGVTKKLEGQKLHLKERTLHSGFPQPPLRLSIMYLKIKDKKGKTYSLMYWGGS